MKTQIMKIVFLFLIGFLFIKNAWCAGNHDSKISKKPQSFLNIQVDYSDVSLFYSVLDKAQEEGKEITGEYMYKNYVQKSSDGLKNGYAKIREDVFPTKNGVIDYTKYDKKIKSLLPFYIKNRDFIETRIIFGEKEIHKIVKRIHEFLGEELGYQLLKNKGVYYSISGAFNMGGTAFSGGIFVDISMIYSDKIDYSVLPEKDEYLNLWKENENVFVIVHEFFHTFQNLLNKNFISDISNVNKKLFYSTSLYTSVVEGGANFFTTKILSEEKPPSDLKDQIEYMKHNPQKYLEFWNDIKKQEKIDNKEEKRKISLRWFYNASTEKVKNGFYPADLGYYIGQKITQKFFEEEIKTRNQETVLKQILRLDVPDEKIEKILTALSKGM